MRQSKAAFRTIVEVLSIFALGTTGVQADLPMNLDFSEGITYIDENSTGGTPSGWFTENLRADVHLSETEQEVKFHLWADYESGACLALARHVSLTPGTYNLSFNYTFDSQVIETPPESDYFSVIAGLTAGGATIPVIATNSGKTYLFNQSGVGQLPFTTTGGDVLLTFLLTRDGAETQSIYTTVCLDDVQLSVVPVPGAAILGIIGLVYSAQRLRRRTAE